MSEEGTFLKTMKEVKPKKKLFENAVNSNFQTQNCLKIHSLFLPLFCGQLSINICFVNF